MDFSEFAIGQTFWTATGEWRCTDLGTRVVIAIKVREMEGTMPDPRSLVGPLYEAEESVFDEYDQDGCAPTREAWLDDFAGD